LTLLDTIEKPTNKAHFSKDAFQILQHSSSDTRQTLAYDCFLHTSQGTQTSSYKRPVMNVFNVKFQSSYLPALHSD